MKWEEIPINIVSYKNSKHIRIFIREGYLKVTKPKHCSIQKAMDLVQSRKEEIYPIFLDTLEKKKILDNKMLYLGEWKQLEVIETREQSRIQMYQDKIEVYLPKGEVLKDILYEFYAKSLVSILQKRVPYYAKQIGANYHKVIVKYMVSRYGSYSHKTKNIHFASILMGCPLWVIDSVIVHELCHNKEQNHGPKFYQLVEHYCPKHQEAHEWLNQNKAYLK